ncbi:hypothetical protein F5Y10DRAFT_136853 [Nemania abortiva]|nr:hypothetical protein F5Y10DRAFT_136853 [Nemania abortiva]
MHRCHSAPMTQVWVFLSSRGAMLRSLDAVPRWSIYLCVRLSVLACRRVLLCVPCRQENEGKPRMKSDRNERVDFAMRTRISFAIVDGCQWADKHRAIHLISDSGTCASETGNRVPVFFLSVLLLCSWISLLGAIRVACMGMDLHDRVPCLWGELITSPPH